MFGWKGVVEIEFLYWDCLCLIVVCVFVLYDLIVIEFDDVLFYLVDDFGVVGCY